MNSPVITKGDMEKILTNITFKDGTLKFANDQPNLALRLLQRYGYIPKTSIITYLTLAYMINSDGKIPAVSMENVDDVFSQIDSNKESVLKQFEADQPEFSQYLLKSYDYIPRTAPVVTMSVANQLVASGDEFKNFMENILSMPSPEDEEPEKPN